MPPSPRDPREEEEPGYEPRSGLARSSRVPWILLALLVLAGGAVVVFRVLQRPPAPPGPAPQAPAAAAPAPEEPAPVPAVGAAGERSLLEAVSAARLFRRCLAEGGPVRRWAVVTDNLAEGVTPRGQLGCAAPAGPFSVVRRRGGTVIAPESYRRYDELAAAVASVDAQAVARAYRALHPVLEAAYRELGYPEASLDRVVARALRRIEAAPVASGDVAVEPQGGLFAFADRRLEDLGAVEKHLLRMGPRNERLLQAKAREIGVALGFPPSAEPGGR